MEAIIIYGIHLYDYKGNETGREYYLNKKERDHRVKTVSASGATPFHFRLSNKSVWQFNYHGIAKERREIEKLKEEIATLKEKLNAKIKLVYETQ